MKRIRYLNYLLVLAFSLMTFGANAQITIGAGTGITSNNPIVSCYGYTYSEQIYTQSEISASGNITSISFYLNTATGGTAESDDWTIYLGHDIPLSQLIVLLLIGLVLLV
jgi:hypothetical protein